jgi:ParB family transcriptional regulator, chromosome partitioning protein
VVHNGAAGYRAVVLFSRFTKIDFGGARRHSVFMSKPALGRGLGALLAGSPANANPVPAAATANVVAPVAPVDTRDRVRRVPLDKIRPSPLQPRKDFSPEALQELADSIKEQGIIQPLVVRERNGFFELIAGERRWRASQLLNLPEVPIITREADDRSVLELALIENLQRENLNPLEEALGYAQLAEQFQLTQEQISAKVGKSRAVVANAVRLLKLPAQVQSFLREGRLSVGHAKVILGLSDGTLQSLAAERVVKEALNVRQTEGLVSKMEARPQKIATDKKSRAMVPVSSNIARLEEKLREKFGTKVHLKYNLGKGAVEINFFNDDELQRVLEILGVNAD